MALTLILLASTVAALSGVPGLLAGRRSRWGERVSASAMLAATLLGLTGSFRVLFGLDTGLLPSGWVESSVRGALGADALSAWFLAPLFIVSGLGSFYGLAYWPQTGHAANGRKLRAFWGMTTAGMALLLVARHAILFLTGWEVMATGAYFLVSAQDRRSDVRQAGWIYLAGAHAGTLCLFALFALLHRATGSYALLPLTPHQAGLPVVTLVFLLALVGFGLKAGIMPLHFWLPSAHANAPSHVSALMSGVLIKMGVYGLVRTLSLLPNPPPAWGVLLLLLGSVSGVLGVALALAQHDLKRLLAYSSIENVGIIVMGLGLGLLGRSLGRPEWILLGLGGALLHVWNHALFKSLLFFGTGSLLHAAHTRELDRLGGLARGMPWTASLFLVGAIAICGLPPLNGFVSEWLLYVGFLRDVGAGGRAAWVAAAAGPVLAVTGALALACFVKAYGVVFLGERRVAGSSEAHDAPVSMLLPMGVLAAACVWLALLPATVAPALQRAAARFEGGPLPASDSLVQLASLEQVGGLSAVLAATAAVAWLLLAWRRPRARAPRTVTWDCGYAAPTPRMQYTASSFSASIVFLFRGALRPREAAPSLRTLFPGAARFDTRVDDPVLDRRLLPATLAIGRVLGRLRALQQGLTQHYVLYVLAAVVILLLWTLPMGSWLSRAFTR